MVQVKIFCQKMAKQIQNQAEVSNIQKELQKKKDINQEPETVITLNTRTTYIRLDITRYVAMSIVKCVLTHNGNDCVTESRCVQSE